jgi:hypothetical protein
MLASMSHPMPNFCSDGSEAGKAGEATSGDGQRSTSSLEFLEAWARPHFICIMGLHFTHRIKALIAPKAKANRRLAIPVDKHWAFSSVLNMGQVDGTGFAQLSKLFLSVFRTGQEFDRTFAVIPVFHRYLMAEAHARSWR